MKGQALQLRWPGLVRAPAGQSPPRPPDATAFLRCTREARGRQRRRDASPALGASRGAARPGGKRFAGVALPGASDGGVPDPETVLPARDTAGAPREKANPGEASTSSWQPSPTEVKLVNECLCPRGLPALFVTRAPCNVGRLSGEANSPKRSFADLSCPQPATMALDCWPNAALLGIIHT